MTIAILSIIYVVVTLVDSVHILTIELNQIAIINCRILMYRLLLYHQYPHKGIESFDLITSSCLFGRLGVGRQCAAIDKYIDESHPI